MEPLTGKTVTSTRIHDGERISLRVDEFTLGDRPAVSKEIVEHPGSVVILPVTSDDHVILVRQWRQPAGQILLEAPSGTREPGEDPMVTAHRELREETGFAAESMSSLGGMWVAPGYSAEYTHAFLASDLHESPLPQDAGEDIHVQKLPLASIPEMIRNGDLQDQMTVATFYAASHLLGRGAA